MEFVEMRRACTSALNLVRQACPNLKIAEDYTPTFTLLIVQKRHRKIKIRREFFIFFSILDTRFWAKGNTNREAK
jgi:hypothetical protein